MSLNFKMAVRWDLEYLNVHSELDGKPLSSNKQLPASLMSDPSEKSFAAILGTLLPTFYLAVEQLECCDHSVVCGCNGKAPLWNLGKHELARRR